jgi:hypothetical protein
MNPGEGLTAVHFRHADIHQHSIVMMLLDRGNRGCAVIGLDTAPSPLPEKGTEGKTMHLIVINHQDGYRTLVLRHVD